MQNVLLDYGLEGYGLYWYCIELIAGKVSPEKITFDLEHDARILARNTGSTAQRVEEMMKYFVKIGLFECSNNTITCLKLAKRLDKSMTSNPQMREIIGNLKSHDSIMTKSAKPMQDKNRLEESRVEENKELLSVKTDVANIIKYFNLITGQKLKTSAKSHCENISARLAEGHSVDDLKLVIDSKFKEWRDDEKMSQYIRPSTLFQVGKFNGYLQQAKANPVKKSSLHDLSGIQYQSGDL